MRSSIHCKDRNKNTNYQIFNTKSEQSNNDPLITYALNAEDLLVSINEQGSLSPKGRGF
jgi:hypothetical protein